MEKNWFNKEIKEIEKELNTNKSKTEINYLKSLPDG